MKALDQSKSVIIMTDLQGRIEYINDTFTAVIGYSKKEVLGNHTRILSSGAQPPNFYKELWTTILEGQMWAGELYNKKKDGTFYWCQSSIYPIKDKNKITGFLNIQLDTTKEKNLVDLNDELKKRLYEQERIASLGMLTSGVMHEIYNPLGYIQGNVKYLLEEVSTSDNLADLDKEDFLDAMQDIDEGVGQIQKIADSLKRYIFNKEEGEIGEVDLLEIINELLVITRNEYKYHANIEVIHKENNNYKIEGYQSKLKQVLMNLIINATHAIKTKNLNEMRISILSLKT